MTYEILNGTVYYSYDDGFTKYTYSNVYVDG